MPRKPQEFQLIIRHDENGPTLEELTADLTDWFTKVLITKEYVKKPESKVANTQQIHIERWSNDVQSQPIARELAKATALSV